MSSSPDSSTICVVWSTFNQDPNQTYVRTYATASGAWSPALSQSAINVSRNAGGSVQGNTTRCAIDGAGRTHVIWIEYPGGRLRYSYLEAGKDAGDINNWTAPVTVASVGENFDSQNPDLASLFADTSGKIWLTFWSLDNSGVFVRSWVPDTGWSSSAKVSNSGGQHPRIAVDNSGYVHVIYKQPGAGLRYSYLDASTGQWNIDNPVPSGGSLIEQAGIAVNRNNGDVHIVFSAAEGDGDNTRVVKYTKKTGRVGTDFSGAINLTGQGNHVVPRIAWSPSGNLTMVSDKRDTRVITFATSNDNGESWSGAGDLTSGTGGLWPSVTMDAVGTSYVAYWVGESIYFVKFGRTP